MRSVALDASWTELLSAVYRIITSSDSGVSPGNVDGTTALLRPSLGDTKCETYRELNHYARTKALR